MLAVQMYSVLEKLLFSLEEQRADHVLQMLKSTNGFDLSSAEGVLKNM